MRVRCLFLLFWLAGILFPAIWLGQFSASYREMFNWIFGPEWMHIFMHLLLYAILAGVLLSALHLFNHLGVVKLFVLILVVGMLQESFQAFSQGLSLWHPAVLRAAFFDVCIDLSGALLGLALFYFWQIRRGSLQPEKLTSQG